MRKRTRWLLIRYASAFLTVLVATALRMALNPWLDDRLPFMIFLFGIIFSAWKLGLGPSILVLVLSTLTAYYFYFVPYRSFALKSPIDLASVLVFVAICSSIIAFSEANRVARLNLKKEIRHRRQAQIAERIQADWLRATLISVGDAVITTDSQGKVRLLNRVAERLTGWTTEEAAGRPFAEVLPLIGESTREKIENPIDQVLREGVIVAMANRAILVAKNGVEIPIDDSAAPISDDRGAIVGVVMVFRDITERRAREAVVEEQRRLAEFGRDIGLVLNEGSDLSLILKRCAELTVKHLDAAFARIWTLNEADNILQLQASSGLYTHLDGAHSRIPVGRFKIGKIAESRLPHQTNSVVGDYLIPEQDWVKESGIVSFAGYPLVVEDRLIGVIAMFGRSKLSDIALKAMQSVSNAIALGILRRWTEDSLRQSEKWLKTTLASIGDAVISTNHEGRIQFLNPVAESLTGWKLGEAVGLPLTKVFPMINELTRESVENPVDKVMRAGVIVGLANHTLLIRRDGREIPIEDSAAPIRDEEGQIVGIVMVFRDVTEARQSEELLRQSEGRKAAILDSALDGIITMDHHGMILEFNPAAEALFGRRRDQAIGRRIAEILIPPSLRESHYRGMARYLETGEGPILNQRIETIGLHSSGVEFPMELAVSRIGLEGPPIFTAHMRDITEARKNAEERERLLAEAQEANQAKTHFLAVLSHELRTPLNPILLVVSSLLEDPACQEKTRPDIEMIRQYVNLQARLIDDLLDVMRIVRGKMPLHWEVDDAHTLIKQAIGVCRSEVLAKGHTLDIDLAAESHHINADPARLQQVLWNLIKNAAKFTPQGGRIAIRTRNESSRDDLRTRIIIEVSDNGIGIEQESLEMIFDPFQQGENSITRRFGGLGLGLAISKGIIEGHGGLLRAESRGKGQGTRFVIELRTLPEPKGVEVVRAPVHNGLGDHPTQETFNILLVEDEPATRRLMARLLKSLGHQVYTAGTIGEGLRIEPRHEINLIISDIGLPDGSGLEMMKAIMERRGHLPAIALTGYGMEDDILRSREAGFTAHMTKPIDFTKLQVMIGQVTSKGVALQEG